MLCSLILNRIERLLVKTESQHLNKNTRSSDFVQLWVSWPDIKQTKKLAYDLQSSVSSEPWLQSTFILRGAAYKEHYEVPNRISALCVFVLLSSYNTMRYGALPMIARVGNNTCEGLGTKTKDWLTRDMRWAGNLPKFSQLCCFPHINQLNVATFNSLHQTLVKYIDVILLKDWRVAAPGSAKLDLSCQKKCELKFFFAKSS